MLLSIFKHPMPKIYPTPKVSDAKIEKPWYTQRNKITVQEWNEFSFSSLSPGFVVSCHHSVNQTLTKKDPLNPTILPLNHISFFDHYCLTLMDELASGAHYVSLCKLNSIKTPGPTPLRDRPAFSPQPDLVLAIFFLIFIVIELQLSAFSPHTSTQPQQNPPPSRTFKLPLDFVHVSFIVFPVIPSPHSPLPTPLWLLLDCS